MLCILSVKNCQTNARRDIMIFPNLKIFPPVRCRAQIEVLTEAGLSPAEVRTLLMTSPQHVMVSLEEIRRNVDFLREALDLDLPQVKKVRAIEADCRHFLLNSSGSHHALEGAGLWTPVFGRV